jgi:hypothetical protein
MPRYVRTVKAIRRKPVNWKASSSNCLRNWSLPRNKRASPKPKWRLAKLSWPVWKTRIANGKNAILNFCPKYVPPGLSYFRFTNIVFKYDRTDPAEIQSFKDEIESLKGQNAELERQKSETQQAVSERQAVIDTHVVKVCSTYQHICLVTPDAIIP